MLKRHLLIVAVASMAAILTYIPLSTMAADTPSPAALTGQVSSKEEGPMEGVLVSAKKAGSTVTVTVVSNAEGRYSFPRSKMEPGQYTLRIRAAGYDLDGPAQAEITSQQVLQLNLNLRPTKNLAAQLTNAEWLVSVPGTDQQKQSSLLNCVNCHTVERILKSGHDAGEFALVIKRMSGYSNSSFPLHPQKRAADRLFGEGEQPMGPLLRQAEFLSSVNLSSVSTWEYPLKTFPRPKGRATRVIVTEYDLPSPTIEPHDVMVDSEGMAWFSDFGEQILGKLDPKTGKVTTYPVPLQKKEVPTGALGLRSDQAGNLWLGMMYQAAIAKFDPKTEKFQVWNIPPEVDKNMSQINMVSPQYAALDGKVWTQDNGFATIHRLDVASGKIETFVPFPEKGKGESHNIYDVLPDSKNNAYFTDNAQEHIGRIDAKTGKITLFPTPTPHSAPRRGQMDSQDRLWFGEYRANKIGMFDTRTEQFKEWTVPTPWSAPYDVALDKNGDAWTGSMTSDRVVRLDPKTGQATEYLLPRETNIRRVFVDNSTTPVTFWVGNNHSASVVKLEPLD